MLTARRKMEGIERRRTWRSDPPFNPLPPRGDAARTTYRIGSDKKRADHADTEDASHTAPEQLHKTYKSLHTTHSETERNHEASLRTQKASGHKQN